MRSKAIQDRFGNGILVGFLDRDRQKVTSDGSVPLQASSVMPIQGAGTTLKRPNTKAYTTCVRPFSLFNKYTR
jgi:hypothetical protein